MLYINSGSAQRLPPVLCRLLRPEADIRLLQWSTIQGALLNDEQHLTLIRQFEDKGQELFLNSFTKYRVGSLPGEGPDLIDDFLVWIRH